MQARPSGPKTPEEAFAKLLDLIDGVDALQSAVFVGADVGAARSASLPAPVARKLSDVRNMLVDAKHLFTEAEPRARDAETDELLAGLGRRSIL
jgi:hypothetical protein